MPQKSLERNVLPHHSSGSSHVSQRNSLDEQEEDKGRTPETDADFLAGHSSELSNPAAILRLQRMIGNRAVTARIRSQQSGAALQRTATTRYSQRQQPTNAANRASLIQRVAYDRYDGTSIFSDVAETAGKITMVGALRIDDQNQTDIDGKLSYKATDITLSKVDNNAFFGGSRTANTYEITTMDAAPRGKKIGQILTYHLGLVARQAGIKYIIAKNVTGARAPFYTPLGFRDTYGDPLFASLVQEVSQIENTIRTDPNADIPQLLERKEAITGEGGLMAENTIFISTADLIQNSLTGFNAQWHRS